MPKPIHDHLKKEFGIEMSPGMISNYESTIKSEGSKSRMIRQPATTDIAKGFSLEEIKAVKEVANKIGADKLRQLAQVLEGDADSLARRRRFCNSGAMMLPICPTKNLP